MNFEDEPYVRLFIRDTANWIRMSWQARAILPSIMKKLDRSGLLDLEVDGVEGVATLAEIIRFPFEVTQAGLDDLLSRGTLTARGTTLVMPNFAAAQSFAKSDAERARDYRKRKREERLNETDSSGRFSSSTAVAKKEPTSPTVTSVTTNRDASPSVTPSRTNVTASEGVKSGQNLPSSAPPRQNGLPEESREDKPRASRDRVTARDDVTLPSCAVLPDLPPEEELPARAPAHAPARAREEQRPGQPFDFVAHVASARSSSGQNFGGENR